MIILHVYYIHCDLENMLVEWFSLLGFSFSPEVYYSYIQCVVIWGALVNVCVLSTQEGCEKDKTLPLKHKSQSEASFPSLPSVLHLHMQLHTRDFCSFSPAATDRKSFINLSFTIPLLVDYLFSRGFCLVWFYNI